MTVLKLKKLDDFRKKHVESTKSINVWVSIVRQANWSKSVEVLMDFPKAKIINAKRARFKIAGNSYRLDIEINYID